jgi:hypothetical protein
VGEQDRILEERNRLWEELQQARADGRELEAMRARVAYMEGSLSWRVTAPLRAGKALLNDVQNALRRRRERARSG